MARIAVIGGGFGGMFALRKLERIGKEHTLVLFEPRERFEFTPLLHEIAGGVLHKDSVTIPYNELFSRVQHVKHYVTAIDFKRKLITAEKQYRFDYVILAQGARTNFSGNNALEMKSYNDALRIRSEIEQNVLKAATMLRHDPKADVENLLHIIIIGGGATGVELAGECLDLMAFRLKREGVKRTPQLTIIHSRNRLLHQFDAFFHKTAAKKLRSKGATILLEAKVTAVRENETVVRIANKEQHLHAKCVIWTAGITPNEIQSRQLLSGHIKIEKTLQLKRYNFAFAIGDASQLDDPLPALAQVASKQGEHAAENIMRLIAREKQLQFMFKSKGTLVSIGQKYGVGKLYGIPIKGFLAWFLMRTIYLMKFRSIRQEFKTAVEYTIRLFKRETKCVQIRKTKR